jgi:competence protein ComEC
MFHSGLTNDTAAQEAFMKAMHIEEETEGAQEHVTRRGTIIDMGDGAYLRILFPDRPMAGADTNTASAVVQLVYGDVEFMLTGDSPQQIEEYLVGLDGEGLASDVLKLGHHGSRTSSSQEFIETVSPKYAVISAGKNNSYGHPHKEVTDLMAREHVPTFVTFEKGTITFETDGKTLFVKN